MVRRNAALSLCRLRRCRRASGTCGHAAALHRNAPAAGSVKYRLKLGDYVNPGTLVAHIGEIEVRVRVPGEVRSLERREGATVRAGDPLVDLSADKNHVWEALRALYLVGQPADLEDVERYTRPVAGYAGDGSCARLRSRPRRFVAARAAP